MMMPPPWERMPKWKLKLMDMLTPAADIQERVDGLLLHDPEELRVQITDDAVFILRVNEYSRMRIPPVQPQRFPLSKLRKDQLDKLREIMEKHQTQPDGQ